MAQVEISRDQMVREALGILAALQENARAGRSNKLADVKGAIEKSLGLEFETYYSFLRRSGYVALGRDASLRLTAEGERALAPERRAHFGDKLVAHFGGRGASGNGAGRDAPTAPAPAAAAAMSATPASPMPAQGVSAPSLDLAGDPALAAIAAGIAAQTRNLMRDQGPTADGSGATAASAAGRAGGAFSARAEPETAARAESRSLETDPRYVKYDALGQGPIATVYRGRHTALGVDVAIKELKDIFGYFAFLQRGEIMKRLRRELCAQAQVRHPSVVPVLDQSCEAARPFYVLELCPGGNLRQRLEAAGPGKRLPAAEAVRLFLQIAYGLRAAHAQGLVHANLKPENVLLDGLGNARLTDFGMTRVIEVDASRGMPQLVVGSISYMGPEQVGQPSGRDLTPAADVYGVGIMLYEMLTGRIPGRRSPLPSTINDEIPAKLDAIFDRMTQDARDQRYPDFDAVLADFYAAFDDGRWLKAGDLVLSSGTVTVAAPPPQGSGLRAPDSGSSEEIPIG